MPKSIAPIPPNYDPKGSGLFGQERPKMVAPLPIQNISSQVKGPEAYMGNDLKKVSTRYAPGRSC